VSLAETQQIMQLCQEIIQLLNNAEVKTTKLIADLPTTKETLVTVRELERVAIRYLAIVRRMGLPDDAANAIMVLSKLIVVIRMLHMSYNMLAASTPFGLLMGLAGFAMTGFAIYDATTGV
jgi:hypothetical protein